LDCVSLGGLVEMKIHYREPTLLELMNEAINLSKKPIDYFELTSNELNANYSNFDRTVGKDNHTSYSYKSIPIRIKE
jgi:hypothetical protein